MVPFIEQTTISVAAQSPESLVPADVDGDGDLDLLSASSQDDRIAWHENLNGDGSSWAFHTITTAANSAVSVAAGDLDGDGDLDVLSASALDDTIAWYENLSGTGSAWTLHTISLMADGASSVFAADVDGDGDLDTLASSVFDDTIAWYENTLGNGSAWTLHTISTTADFAIFVTGADVDGDGDIDALSASQFDSTVAWYENSAGDGSAWILHTISTTSGAPSTVTAVDFDGDGDEDVLVGAIVPSGSEIAWYENEAGDGSVWIPHAISTTAQGVTDVAAIDLDDDGDADVLSVSNNVDGVYWYENNLGSGSAWTQHTITTTIDGAVAVAAADLDGDGDIDAASGEILGDEITWYRNETIHRSASFPSVVEISATPDIAEYSVHAADLDGDGDVDAIASNIFGTITWYENDGDGGTWGPHLVTDVTSLVFSVQTADVDGDGDLDILTASTLDDRLNWYENLTGDGLSWTTHVLATDADAPRSVAAADVDGDGDVDVFSASVFDNRIAWYENLHGNGSVWVSRTISTSAMGAQEVSAADVDNDGDLDLFSASGTDDKIAWYENIAGDGTTWTTHIVSVSEAGASSVFAVDLDGDGDVDALSASRFDNRIAWHENVGGDGLTWISRTISASALGATSVVAADLDGDGDFDALAAVFSAHKIAWYENIAGDGSTWLFHDVPATVVTAIQVVAADLDNDGDFDALSASRTRDVGWHENRGGQFALPTESVASVRAQQGSLDELLKIDLTHRGRNGESDVELATLELFFTDGSATPLDSAQANALVERLLLFRDDGDGGFDPAVDTQVAVEANLSLAAGLFTFAFPDGNPAFAAAAGVPITFFLAAEWMLDASTAVPDDLTVTHLTSTSSTGEDAAFDIPLLLEKSGDTTAGPIELNDPPVAVDDGGFMVNEDTALASGFSLLDNDTDEEGDPLTAVLVTAPTSAAEFTLNADGTFSYTPAGDFGGSDSFSYSADDGLATSDAISVAIAVTPVADTPSLIVSNSVGTVDTAIALSISASLADMDGSETLTIEISSVPPGATLSAGIDAGGGFWELQLSDLAGLTITPPAGDDSDFTLAVVAIATESGNGNTASTMDALQVIVRLREIFADGFDSGGTGAWSSSVP